MKTIRTILKFFVFAGLVVMLSGQYLEIYRDAGKILKGFIQSGMNFEVYRRFNPVVAVALDAAKVIPPESAFKLSPIGRIGGAYVTARYTLYPSEIKDDWDYYVNFFQKFTPLPPGWTLAPLTGNSAVFARPGKPLLANQTSVTTYPARKILFVFFSAVLAYLFTGISLLRLLGRTPDTEGSAGYLSTAFLTGFVITNGILWSILLTGAHLSRELVLLIWLLPAGLLFWLSQIRTGGRPVVRCPAPADPVQLTTVLAIIVIGLLAMMIAVTPVCDWDAMSHWLLKSKILYYHHQLTTLKFQYVDSNYYPILWPLHNAVVFVMMNGPYDETAQWMSAIMFLCFMAQLVAGCRCLGILRRDAATVLLFFLGMFFLYRSMNASNAENVFMALQTGAGVALARWLSKRELADFAVGLILCAGLAVSKFEGFVSVAAMAMGVLVFGFCPGRAVRSLTDAAGIAATMILPFLWIVWVGNQGYLDPIEHVEGTLSWPRIMLGLRMVYWFFLYNPRYLFAFSAWFLTYLLYRKERHFTHAESFFLFAGIGLFLFAFVAEMGSTSNHALQNFEDVFCRLLLHAFPLFIFVWAGRIFGQSKEKGT